MKRWLQKHVIPHQGNDFQPTILQKAAMGAMLGLVVVSFVAASAQSLLWTNFEWMVSAVLPAVIVEETNSERTSGSARTLRRNELLDRAATLKAEHMAQNGYFAHYSPDGVSPWHWFNQAGYAFVHAGENLAVHFSDSEEIVDAWMQSPSHRANIMNAQFSEIGIGVARGEFEGSETIFVVQLFGTPAAAAFAPAPTTPSTVTVVSEQVEEVPAQAATPALEVTQVASANETVSEEEVMVKAPSSQLAPPPTQGSDAFVEVRETAAAVEIAGDDTVLQDTTQTQSQDATSRFSETITTSTDAVIGAVDENEPRSGRGAVQFGFLTSPQTVLQLLYVILGIFVALTLALSAVIEARRQKPLQIAYSAGLAFVMLGLFYLHTFITSGVIIA